MNENLHPEFAAIMNRFNRQFAEVFPVKPVAQVVARTRLENESSEEVPRIVALDKSLPVGTLLYADKDRLDQLNEILNLPEKK